MRKWTETYFWRTWKGSCCALTCPIPVKNSQHFCRRVWYLRSASRGIDRSRHRCQRWHAARWWTWSGSGRCTCFHPLNPLSELGKMTKPSSLQSIMRGRRHRRDCCKWVSYLRVHRQLQTNLRFVDGRKAEVRRFLLSDMKRGADNRSKGASSGWDWGCRWSGWSCFLTVHGRWKLRASWCQRWNRINRDKLGYFCLQHRQTQALKVDWLYLQCTAVFNSTGFWRRR